jgi:hypothetical protein
MEFVFLEFGVYLYLFMRTFHFILCFLASVTAFSQAPPRKDPGQKKPFWSWDRVVFGGSIAPYFSNTITSVHLAPTMGYRITERYEAGAGPVYIYLNDKFYHYKFHIYGATLYNKFYLFDFLFLYAEYNPLNGKFDYFFPDRRVWAQDVWIGGGLNQRSGRLNAFIMALWNVNETYPLFRSPRISVGFGF